MSIIEAALKKSEDGKKQQKKPLDSHEHGQRSDDAEPLGSKLADYGEQKEKGSICDETANPIDNREVIHIDWERLRALGFITSQDANSKLAEEFRSIKRPLVINAFVKGKEKVNRANLILITSSVPGEGKTFVSINLALSIANERDKKVLLIDADLAKPSISSQLGIKSSPGLIEYLEGSANFSEIVSKTDLRGLRVIPSGKKHRFAHELLVSERMQQLCDELSQRYTDRIVIFDSPPLLAATHGEVLAELVGQVVLVVGAEQTSQSDIKAAVEKLQKSELVLSLLNKTESDFTPYRYGTYGS